jgi:hypothetical protein
MSSDWGSFLGREIPPAFVRREVLVAPGLERIYDESEWWDALVVVARGALELECVSGRRCCFEAGAMLWLVGLPLRALHARGDEPAVLIAVSRRRCDEFRPPAPS